MSDFLFFLIVLAILIIAVIVYWISIWVRAGSFRHNQWKILNSDSNKQIRRDNWLKFLDSAPEQFQDKISSYTSGSDYTTLPFPSLEEVWKTIHEKSLLKIAIHPKTIAEVIEIDWKNSKAILYPMYQVLYDYSRKFTMEEFEYENESEINCTSFIKGETETEDELKIDRVLSENLKEGSFSQVSLNPDAAIHVYNFVSNIEEIDHERIEGRIRTIRTKIIRTFKDGGQQIAIPVVDVVIKDIKMVHIPGYHLKFKIGDKDLNYTIIGEKGGIEYISKFDTTLPRDEQVFDDRSYICDECGVFFRGWSKRCATCMKVMCPTCAITKKRLGIEVRSYCSRHS